MSQSELARTLKASADVVERIEGPVVGCDPSAVSTLLDCSLRWDALHGAVTSHGLASTAAVPDSCTRRTPG